VNSVNWRKVINKKGALNFDAKSRDEKERLENMIEMRYSGRYFTCDSRRRSIGFRSQIYQCRTALCSDVAGILVSILIFERYYIPMEQMSFVDARRECQPEWRLPGRRRRG
jgi:hypothetical protein